MKKGINQNTRFTFPQGVLFVRDRLEKVLTHTKETEFFTQPTVKVNNETDSWGNAMHQKPYILTSTALVVLPNHF